MFSTFTQQYLFSVRQGVGPQVVLILILPSRLWDSGVIKAVPSLGLSVLLATSRVGGKRVYQALSLCITYCSKQLSSSLFNSLKAKMKLIHCQLFIMFRILVCMGETFTSL